MYLKCNNMEMMNSACGIPGDTIKVSSLCVREIYGDVLFHQASFPLGLG